VTNEVWFADLSTWRGSIGAIHYYVKMRRGHGRLFSVERVLTADEAKFETDNDSRYIYNEGEWKTGWLTVEDAEHAAVTAFRALANEGDLLLRGHHFFVPDKALDGPPDVMAAFDALDDDHFEMERLIEKYGLTVREGSTTFGHGAPPEDPDLPQAMGVLGDEVQREEKDW
jgi:hypothetical protein